MNIGNAAVSFAPLKDDEKCTRERVAVVGLGYVGLPLCMALADGYETVVGYDISQRRISTLQEGSDYTHEVSGVQLQRSSAVFTNAAQGIADATFYIVTVPTPVRDDLTPDLEPLRSACAIIGPMLQKGNVVVFESTVYPGVTEEFCGPLLEAASGLVAGVDFNLGYSPERINPGDKLNSISTIVKVVSADSEEALERVADLYSSIVTAGIHRAPSIRVAEFAKVLENTQRDVNIALMNEVAMICRRINVRTSDVLEAAGTKWNFIKMTPGLVGGHCIGVDPYYLATLAEQTGLQPDIIRASRNRNERIIDFIVDELGALLAGRSGPLSDIKVGVLGLTFKEDVPDVRNSKSIELAKRLAEIGFSVLTHDPLAVQHDLAKEGITPATLDDMWQLDVLVLAVPHRRYIHDPHLVSRVVPGGVVVDIKSALDPAALPGQLQYWSL
jgi:UDP-N-acetyl-D-glucosamine/UDP-N-acetyl-D-galactosamine dehydrogenase